MIPNPRIDLYRRRAKSPADVPKGPHYAIIVFKTSSVYVEGDERSRTHPGHGYPGGTETFESNEYYPFDSRADWEAAVQHLFLEKQGRTDVLAFEVAAVASPTVHIQVKL